MSTGYKDLTTYIAEELRSMIWEEVLEPGQRIKQEEIAQKLGVSRTPVIRALQKLEAERLVEYRPRRGFAVKALGLEEMLEIFDLRAALEAVAAAKAAERASDDQIRQMRSLFEGFGGSWTEEAENRYMKNDQTFHSMMSSFSGNGLIEQINGMFNIYRLSYQRGLIRHPSETLDEHRRLIEAIAAHDTKQARVLALEHIDKSRSTIENVFRRQKGLSEDS